MTSCQNRNQVTHNKRKYRKGYYKPNRAKVKNKKYNKKEEYTYDNKSNQPENKSAKAKVEHSVAKTQKIDENEKVGNNSSATRRNVSNYPEDIVGKDGVQQENEKKNILRRTHENSSESQDEQNEEEENEKPKKTNWMYWLSLAFILLGIIAFCIGLVLIFVGIWLTAIVLSIFFFMVIFGMLMNIKNIKTTKGDESRKFLRNSSIVMLIIFSLMLAFALLLAFSVAFGSY